MSELIQIETPRKIVSLGIPGAAAAAAQRSYVAALAHREMHEFLSILAWAVDPASLRPAEPQPQPYGFGTGNCKCGRRISLNKTSCLGCSE